MGINFTFAAVAAVVTIQLFCRGEGFERAVDAANALNEFQWNIEEWIIVVRCRHARDNNYGSFLDVPLELRKGVCSVEGALKVFTSTEQLDGYNCWYCCESEELVTPGVNISMS